MGAQSNRGQRGVTRILLVDDHPLVLERLAEVIDAESDLCVCGQADGWRRAMDVAAESRPDLAIVDLSLRESDGLDLIKDLSATFPSVKILVVSMRDEENYAERSMRAGAHGFINKQEASREILQAIRKIIRGELYLSPKASARAALRMARQAKLKNPDNPLDALADREMRVFELVGEGKSTRQIAEYLHLGVSTVETYRLRIKDKLGLKDASELLQLAINSREKTRRTDL